MGQIFLIRHGQASFGSDDYDRLSTLGSDQAALLGRWFEACGLPVDRVIAGALRRHRETASGFFAGFGARDAMHIDKLTIDARFNEFDHVEVMDMHRDTVHGSMTGINERAAEGSSMSSAQLQRLYLVAMERWMSDQHHGDYRESWPQFRQRCIEGFEALADSTHPAKAIAVFTSGGVIAALCQHVLELTDKATRELNWSLANTGVTRLLFSKGRRGLGYLNSTAHFDWARKPDLLTYR